MGKSGGSDYLEPAKSMISAPPLKKILYLFRRFCTSFACRPPLSTRMTTTSATCVMRVSYGSGTGNTYSGTYNTDENDITRISDTQLRRCDATDMGETTGDGCLKSTSLMTSAHRSRRFRNSFACILPLSTRMTTTMTTTCVMRAWQENGTARSSGRCCRANMSQDD